MIAEDFGALIKARSDPTINVLVSRGLPRGDNPRGAILFLARPEKRPPGQTMQMRDPGELAAGHQTGQAELKVKKVYALPDGDYAFCAYEVEWQGQDVIVRDHSANMKHEVGDTITVMVRKSPHFDANRSYGLLTFELLPQRMATRPKRR